MTPAIYSPLLTDFYQLTMAYGYWKLNMHEQPAAFHLLFRKNPFGGNHALNCGLNCVIEFLTNWHFKDDDLAYLASLQNTQQQPLFPKDFLAYLKTLRFSCDIDAIPEGTIVFANEPLVRIQGPLIQCQLLETPLLNIINFQTLIATKASRVCHAAQDDPVIEFGMRRAQGPDGALSASRAAYIGGCVATSNTLAGKLYDIPVRGTHAHSWVSAFDSEQQAFDAYAKIMPQNCVLLVDTYNTLEGVGHAIETGKQLRAVGADLLGIRLDSGDMVELSIKARQLLDAAGFKNTRILASNSIDEDIISKLKQQGAKVDSWGVGTSIATAYDNPALDGVYKLSALETSPNKWTYKLKLSEDKIKISNPGRHQIRRFFCNDQYVMDVIYDLDIGIAEIPETVLLNPAMEQQRLDDFDAFVDLLIPIMRAGKIVAELESIHAIRKRAVEVSKDFWSKQKGAVFSVGLEKRLYELKTQMISDITEKN